MRIIMSGSQNNLFLPSLQIVLQYLKNLVAFITWLHIGVFNYIVVSVFALQRQLASQVLFIGVV